MLGQKFGFMYVNNTNLFFSTVFLFTSAFSKKTLLNSFFRVYCNLVSFFGVLHVSPLHFGFMALHPKRLETLAFVHAHE